MNLRLISLAFLLAMSVAQAETILYGKFHGSIDFADNGTDSSMFVSSNSSRLGVKGHEDLGNGLTAVYQVESSIDFSGDNDSALAGRNTYVGLKGGFGMVMMGRHDTPFKLVSRKFDLFGDQIGDSRAILRRTANRVLGYGWDERPSNVLAYGTPKFGDFSALIAWVPQEEATGINVVSLNGFWTPGNFTLGFGYESTDDKVFGGDPLQAFRLGASYKFGNGFYLTGLFQTADYGQNTDNAFGLGAAYKFGKNKIKGQVYFSDNDGNDNNGTLLALGWDYKMSKMTTLYVAAAFMMNDDNAPYTTVRGTGHDGELLGLGVDNNGNAKDYNTLSFGIVVKF